MVYCAVCGRYFRTLRAALTHFIKVHRDMYVRGAGIDYLVRNRLIVTEDRVREFFEGLRSGKRLTDVTVLRRCMDDPSKYVVRLTRDDGERIVVVTSDTGLDYLRHLVSARAGRWVW